MNSKIRFPLKFKLISLISVLLLASISFYVFYAVDLFKKDKSAYVFETSLSVAESLSDGIQTYFKNGKQALELLSDTFLKGRTTDELKQLLGHHANFLEFEVVQDGQSVLLMHDEKEFNKRGIQHTDFYRDFVRERFGLKNINENQLHVDGHADHKVPHLLLAFKNQGKLFTGRLALDSVLDSLKKNKIYDSFLIDRLGAVLVTQKETKVFSRVLKSIVDGDLSNGVKEVLTSDGVRHLVAFSKLTHFPYYVVSQIPQAKAFQASSYLINKSFYFGALILGLAILIGVFFARSLTASLERLFTATTRIAEGDFTSKVEVKSNDEIGSLTQSFNYMSEEILRFMDEMKEKARLENELAVAQLVQSAFFPLDDIQQDNLQIAAYYTPATECGGDWWGHIEHDETHILFLADATGHGVPAALLTATAHSSVNNLKQMAAYDDRLLASPAKMMSFLNQAVCNVGSEIMMTFFIALIDLRRMQLVYSNASHNTPFLYHQAESEPTKSDLIPLMEANGTRLGHKAGETYSETRVNLSPGDTLILYTDGIIECENNEGKAWGKRNFIKSILRGLKQDASYLRDNIVQEAVGFYGEKAREDDVTLIVSKINLGHGGGRIKILNLLDAGSTEALEQEFKAKSFRADIHNDFEPQKADIIILDPIHAKEMGEKFLSDYGQKIFLISHLSDEENILAYLVKFPICHIVGSNAERIVTEIRRNVIKRFTREIWGVERYLNEGDQVLERSMTSSTDIDKSISDLIESFDYSLFFDSPKQYLQMMANELATNAFYNASKTTTNDRQEKVDLSDDKKVTLKMGINENLIALSIQDNFGGLSREKVIQNLERSFKTKQVEHKEGGAGIGLYMVCNYANQFIVNTKAGKKTEVICIIDRSKRLKNYKQRITSFHFHNEDRL